MTRISTDNLRLSEIIRRGGGFGMPPPDGIRFTPAGVLRRGFPVRRTGRKKDRMKKFVRG